MSVTIAQVELIHPSRDIYDCDRCVPIYCTFIDKILFTWLAGWDVWTNAIYYFDRCQRHKVFCPTTHTHTQRHRISVIILLNWFDLIDILNDEIYDAARLWIQLDQFDDEFLVHSTNFIVYWKVRLQQAKFCWMQLIGFEALYVFKSEWPLC